MSDKSPHDVKILAVEDNAGDYGLIRVYLRLAGYGSDAEHDQVIWVKSLAEAIESAAKTVPDIVLLDLSLPDSSGLNTVKSMRKALSSVPIIVLSGNDDNEVTTAAMEEGAQDYLIKGHYEHDAIGKAIRHALIRAKIEARLRLLEVCIDRVSDAIVITEAEPINEPGPRIIWANKVFYERNGYSPDEVIGKSPRILQGPDTNRATLDKVREALEHWQPIRSETLNYRKDGSTYWNEFEIVPIADEKGWFTHWVSVQRDTTQRKQMEEQVRQLAFYDPLTQLPNRRLLNDRLSQTISASKRNGLYGALMFLDLDNFKPINDEHGHGVGDLLLTEAANRLKNCVREMDTVARFGGDEFVIMLSELDIDEAESNLQASLVAEKIRATLSESYLLTIKHEGQSDIQIEHHCTASIGVVIFIGQEVCQDDLIERADAAMYQAKEGGRNQIRFYRATA